jgi:hypothetical protein
MCGFSDITSRGIMYVKKLIRNPPLILQLENYDPQKQYLCHVVLIDDRKVDFRNIIAKPDRWKLEFEKTKRFKIFDCLFGNTTTMGVELKDTNNECGMFFIFHDLSIRAQGYYRLLCTCTDMLE